jgi:hypothetical protein
MHKAIERVKGKFALSLFIVNRPDVPEDAGV